MRAFSLLLIALFLSGCGGGAKDDTPGRAEAVPGAAPVASSTASSLSDADRAAVLKAAMLVADAQGQVLNECGERITPQLLTVDLGTKVGGAVLLVMTGGPNQPSCYGDGPGLTLLRNAAGTWREIYSSRGGSLVVMKQMHDGAPDIAHGGPGFSHPVFEWNGTEYQPAKREVPDDRIADATILP